MLFDCQKVDAEAVDSFRPRICFGSPRAEYDFDAGNIGIPGDPPDLTRHDNRIHYGMEWRSPRRKLLRRVQIHSSSRKT